MNASPLIQWLSMRKTSAFAVKRGVALFSRQPANVANKHSFKYSNVQRVASAEEGKDYGCVFVTAGTKKRVNHGAQANKNGKRPSMKSAAKIAKQMKREDLTKDLVERVRVAHKITNAKRAKLSYKMPKRQHKQ